MENYILQTIVFQLAFLLVYELLLKKETFFLYNRLYLLITPILALVLPLLNFPILQSAVPVDAMVLLPEVFISSTSGSVNTPEISGVSSEAGSVNFWLLIYGTGVLIAFLIFLKKFSILKSLFSNPVVSEDANYRIVRVANSDIACTFFNTIFLGEQLSEEEVEQILSHEMVHVQHRHSLDLLFFEIQKILFWFNPLIYIYQSRLSVLHEYIADAGVVKKVEKRTYYQQLLNTAFGTKDISFINQFFNHSIIKKRIVMLQKSRSKTIAKFKYLILVPLMLVMLTYVACAEGPEKESENAAEVKVREQQPEQASKKAETDVPFAVLEQVPVFPGCEDLATHEEQKNCFIQHLTDYVNRNFDTSIGKRENLTGLNRTYVQFRINTDGSIEVLEVRGPHEALEAEGKRVVSSLPQMKPGEHDGKVVPVLFSLPITFEVGE
ncbi:M56 family metallopeptidase [Salinimicrobium soli]|uniref:M56 family metallopeptidase n=1 Tax=Salinimicrobium soli TaxID=1254399 RepID=UPI003AAED50F